LENNKQITVSLEDGGLVETVPAGFYKGMYLLSVRFYLDASTYNDVAMAGTTVMKGAKFITTMSHIGERLINVFCKNIK
jgi:hypothetical protein